MEIEKSNLVKVRFVKDIPFYAKVGDEKEVPEYDAHRFVRHGTAEILITTEPTT